MNKLNTVITLRDTMRLKYPVAFSFHRIVLHTDLPYNFNQERKYWWRWYSDIYGFFYNRVKRSYSIWLTMFLKHNIGIYISFLFKMPGKHSRILDDWKRRAFLYNNTLQRRNIYNQNFIKFNKLDFWTVNYLALSEAAKNILFPGNKVHRAMGSPGVSGLDLDTFISSYNGKWNNLYKPESMFYNTTRMPRDFFVVVNSFFISSGFFISSFDSLLILYPQFFLEYCTKLYNQKILNLISFFTLKFNLFFYFNILTLIIHVYVEFLQYKFLKFVNLNLSFDINFELYKINLYVYFIKYYYNVLINSKNQNYWLLFLIFLNKYNVYNLILVKDKYINKFNNYKFVYMIYFFNYLKYSSSWLNSSSYKDIKYNWKYDFFFKYINRFYLYKQRNLDELSKSVSFKKLYIFEWIHFWKFLNNWNINFNNMKQKKQSLFFINKYLELINLKYGNIPNVYNLLKFFNNIKTKFLEKKIFSYKNFGFIKPSIITKRAHIFTTLRGVTNFGKYFVRVPDTYIDEKNISIFYSKMQNTSRAILYFKYSKNFLAKLSGFLKDFFFLIMSAFKLNFGFSYSLISRKKKFNLNLDFFFFYNIQYYLYLFFFFIKKYFNKKRNLNILKNSFLVNNLKLTDKVLFFFFYLIPKKKKFKKNLKKIYYNYKYKGMNLNKLAYLKFFNNK